MPHNQATSWQLKMRLPGAVLALQCDEYAIWETHYLSLRNAELPPQNALAAEAARQLRAYLRRPRGHRFDLPLAAATTAFQRKVRAIVQSLAGGQIATYSGIAQQAHSAPRAVGGACRANRVPLLVPCHRVVAQSGVGGFMGDRGSHRLDIKRQLLRHEGVNY